MKDLIKKIKNEYGTDIINHREKLIGLMLDLSPDLEREIRLFKIGLDAQCNILLSESKTNKETEAAIRRLEIKLKKDYFLNEDSIKNIIEWFLIFVDSPYYNNYITSTNNTASGGMSSNNNSNITVNSNDSDDDSTASLEKDGCAKYVVFWIIVAIIVIGIFVVIFRATGCGCGCATKESEDSIETNNTNQDSNDTSYIKDIWLTSIDAAKQDDAFYIEDEETHSSNTGVQYSHIMYAQSSYQEASFCLNGEYDILKGIWCICDGSEEDDNKNSFAIFADGRQVFNSPVVNAGETPHDLYVDIKECKVLTILFKEGIGALELGDLRLTNEVKKEKKDDKNNNDVTVYPSWLTDVDILQNDQCVNVEDYEEQTNTGQTISHLIFADEPGSIEFYLNGKYDYLTGIWGIVDYMNNDVEKEAFEIYADGKKIFSSRILKRGDTPEEISVSLKKCKKLKIVFTKTSSTAYLGNARVSPAY